MSPSSLFLVNKKLSLTFNDTAAAVSVAATAMAYLSTLDDCSKLHVSPCSVGSPLTSNSDDVEH